MKKYNVKITDLALGDINLSAKPQGTVRKLTINN